MDQSRSFPSWRNSSKIKIHPAAEWFPLLPKEELQQLADDIEKNGLREPVAIIPMGRKQILLDGRNRLDAMELAGIRTTDDEGMLRKEAFEIFFHERVLLDVAGETQAFVVSKNLRRRHLSTGQRCELATKILTTTPNLSNRAIGKQVKLDKNTVQMVRQKAGSEW